MVLARMAKRRQHRIRLGLPDALDLLVVSVEAGLGLDQAIQRVGEELAFAHPDLCERAAADQPRAARRQGARRGAAQPGRAHRRRRHVSSLVAMLVQTDKFGTSVAQSLRVHSETVRTKRRQRAEEAAAKTGVKMVFPLVFCIFPAIWVVTIGPAAIKFIEVIGPMANEVADARPATVLTRRIRRRGPIRRRRAPARRRRIEETGSAPISSHSCSSRRSTPARRRASRWPTGSVCRTRSSSRSSRRSAPSI